MKYLILVFVIFISGCTTISGLLNTAGAANDKALIASEVTMCRAASIGAVMRRYNTEKKARAWKDLCTQNNESAKIILDN